ncbi:hypothetical protein [Laceyella putida]|uniref:Uncharacterized protein n=1 Tax=Laceyella putida TaxID=110101 RepID=A0ABW2RJF3_9BACL
MNKEAERTNFSIHVGGDVGNNAMIGDFSRNQGTINSHNRVNAELEKESKVAELKRLIEEFSHLTEQSKELSTEEREESLELMELNHRFIEEGKPKRAVLKSLVTHLDDIKSKLKADSPLLTNVGSISQILSLFL